MSPVQGTPTPTRAPQKTVLVTGASGYLGFAVSRAFVRAGWRVYGVTRRASASGSLAAEEIHPVVGSIGADLSFLDALLAHEATRPFDVVVSCTEQMPFDEHWTHLLSLFTKVAEHAKGAAKPFVLMSSGCKDYGTTARHGDPGLAPHTETSPLAAPPLVATRAECVVKVLEHADLFDAVVIRPTPIFGYGGSYYGVIFDALGHIAANNSPDIAKAGGKVQVLVPGHPDTIYHGCHVDDCAEAYVSLAEHADRAAVVAGRTYNVSAHRYETVGEILAALAPEYGFGSLLAVPADECKLEQTAQALEPMLGFSQWVDSAKIRALTGWADRRALFSEDAGTYKAAYEAAVEAGDDGVARIRDRVGGWVAKGVRDVAVEG